MENLKKCFSCGERFDNDLNSLLSKYKKEFEQKGIIRYYYHLGDNKIKICRAETFKVLFKNVIKKELKNGAEYARIDEFTGL